MNDAKRCLRLVGWSRHEHADARKSARMPWVKTPTSHDGLGFLTLMDHADGMAHFGAWNLILQVAANCPTRGVLITDGGRPIQARELALKTRGSCKLFEEAIARLVEIGWLEWVDAASAVAGDHLRGTEAERGEPEQVDRKTESGDPDSGGCREGIPTASGELPDSIVSRGEGEEREGRVRGDSLPTRACAIPPLGVSNSTATASTDAARGDSSQKSPPCPGPALPARKPATAGSGDSWWMALREGERAFLERAVHISRDSAGAYRRDLDAIKTLVEHHGLDVVVNIGMKLITHGKPPFATRIRDALKAAS